MKRSRTFCAAACSSAAALSLGCSHPPATTSLAKSLTAAANVSPVDAGAGADAGAVTDAGANDTDAMAIRDSNLALDPYSTAVPVSAKSIGHTSYVLKVVLEGGLVGAYKPSSTLPLGRQRYKGEIAAYRLALALGLENVPRAIPRAFLARALRGAFSTSSSAADFDRKAAVDSTGLVRGALIPWIPDYQVLPLEQAAWRARWQPWLMDGRAPIPPEQRPLASSISTMLVFDYVTANWDRWSGANVARAGAAGPLLYVDNDGAFYEHPAPGPLAGQLATLKRVVRFSKSLVAALRSLDAARAGAIMGEESPGVPLLSERAIADVAARAQTVLAVIDACVKRRGDAAYFEE